LDILSTPLTDTAHKDRIGRTSIEAGGTACNAAFDLRMLGMEVRLLTAWGNSPIEHLMASHIESQGVELMADEVPGMPLAAFAAILTHDGDLDRAVSSTPVDTHHFSDERVEQALECVDYAILDCNLSEDSIAQIARCAHDRNIRLFALAVSEDKVERIKSSAHLFEAVFMNAAESERLMELANAADPSELAEVLKTTLFITRGDRGAVVYQRNGERLRIQAPMLYEVENTLGAGDAFSVGVIDGVVRRGMDFVAAAEHAHVLVQEIARSGACNAFSMNALNTMVSDLYADARNDKLTSLLRRSAFEGEYKRFQDGWNSLVLIDCDRFKAVNDTLGHQAGDEVLQRVASIIRTGIRAWDIPSRWGGDEFVVLLPRTNKEDARLVAERIRLAAAGAELYGVTLSIGVAISQAGEGIEELVKRADEAMYVAKQAGRNAVSA
jgi:diguanylate cyclase (GGDEF)-like protein